MILGVGDGTFAILFVTVIGIIVTLIGSYVQPRLALPIGLVCFLLPFLLYACILSAPHGRLLPPLPDTPYNRERRLPPDAVVVDHLLPVRIGVMILLFLAFFAAVGYHVLLVIWEPPYKAPRVRCLREQLKELHPTWYR
ncbi:hypothetical protein C3747_66g187c [Trypanosoma cruzi]|uniref:Uncharacterized protein n=2 Tax=Trypanosoma cruzi TaxID=5693 RepID=Q4CUF3_TRYCC|nr:hypothetical protein, conserved [Trypanosoma cruzi]EAN83902.1 hypothetical protein, conserved [Trypanosoma cruzi]PWV10712.1 hypothetical protein C3747_66g187c [Trypanosoma cruzi]RNC45827.1 hypothetical protein TcCL_NonESM04357 [Trypanosoma cruzi]|eukprot:XP_805753.1 hypothetical protein [Trypanosoma cruzi strain CL Brener]